MLLAASTPALSADAVDTLPVASFNWTGAYIGVVDN